MAQLTIRIDDQLGVRVKDAAARSSSSVNAYVVAVLDAATDPNLATSEAERLRERLQQAGLLAPVGSRKRGRPPAAAVVRARAAAGKGTPLSEIVSAAR